MFSHECERKKWTHWTEDPPKRIQYDSVIEHIRDYSWPLQILYIWLIFSLVFCIELFFIWSRKYDWKIHMKWIIHKIWVQYEWFEYHWIATWGKSKFLVELATGVLGGWQISLSQYAEGEGVEHTTHLLSPSCTLRCKQKYTFSIESQV